ncbi:hypothetical protein HDV05_007744, partial [Chytridiales sp. JEL 0842]
MQGAYYGQNHPNTPNNPLSPGRPDSGHFFYPSNSGYQNQNYQQRRNQNNYNYGSMSPNAGYQRRFPARSGNNGYYLQQGMLSPPSSGVQSSTHSTAHTPVKSFGASIGYENGVADGYPTTVGAFPSSVESISPGTPMLSPQPQQQAHRRRGSEASTVGT